MKFKVGDHVIISKPFINILNIKAHIIEIDSEFNYFKIAYQREHINEWNIDFYETCNIFFDSDSVDSIEIDVEYYRDLKLKELGL